MTTHKRTLALAIALSLAGCGSPADDMQSNGVCTTNCGAAATGATSGASGAAGMTGSGGAAGMQIVAGMTGSGGAAGITSGGAGGAAGTSTGGAGGVAGMTGGAGGVAGMEMAGAGAMGGAGGEAGTGPMTSAGCTPAPSGAVTDFGARGPFEVMQVANTGPSGQYTMFRPTTLGEGGFMHPPVSWGNGVGTTPALYVELLSTVASHGFVVIATNATSINAMLVRQGLEWLIDQNGSGEFAGKLAVDCAATIGYSMGGGSAVGAGAHPAVKAVVSLHGLTAASAAVSGPLLLVTSDDDNFVSKAMFVKPTYDQSSVQPTIMATLETGRAPSFNGHLIPLGDAMQERAPMVAWLRYWLYGDEGAKPWFFGSDCTLCKAPWMDIQKKNLSWD